MTSGSALTLAACLVPAAGFCQKDIIVTGDRRPEVTAGLRAAARELKGRKEGELFV